METILLLNRLLLAGTFAVAGATKLYDLPGSRRTLKDFGIPTSVANIFGTVLPLTEITLAVILIPAVTAWWGALGVFALLLLFIVGISLNLLSGRKPDCHCFGVFSSAPIGWSTVARNGILAALAGFLVWQGPNHVDPSTVGWLNNLTVTEIIAFIIVAINLALLTLEGWFLLHLLRQNGRLLIRIETLEKALGSNGKVYRPSPALPMPGLPFGTPAPVFQLPGLYGETLTLDALRSSGKPVMLIFADPGCGPCNSLMPEIATWQHSYVSKLTIALISRGTIESNREKSNQHKLTHILLQRDREIAESYLANGTPSAVIIQPDGTIGSPLAAGADEIRDFLTQIVQNPTGKPAALPATEDGCGYGNGNGNSSGPASRTTITKIGERTPGLKLADLKGKLIDLTDFRGSKTLVLFWNPGCGFCNRMLGDLKQWESNHPEGAPKLLIVSTGSIEANQALGLQSSILLDQNFNVGRIFGASGTPSAILVDENGNIASEVAVGAPAVLALADAAEPDYKIA